MAFSTRADLVVQGVAFLRKNGLRSMPLGDVVAALMTGYNQHLRAGHAIVPTRVKRKSAFAVISVAREILQNLAISLLDPGQSCHPHTP